MKYNRRKRSFHYSSQLTGTYSHDSAELHKQWIEGLLVDYYDPMYDYQMKKR